MNQVKEHNVAIKEKDEYDILLEQQKIHVAIKRKQREKRARIRKLENFGIILVLLYLCVTLFMVIVNNSNKSDSIPATSIAVNKKEAKQPDSKSADEKDNNSDYVNIEFAKKENQDRYDKYRALNPQLTLDEVVWQVNANLDKPKYSYDVPVDGYDDPYIIVNKYYKVPDGYRPPDLVNIDGQLMRAETGEAYKKMRDAAKKEGLSIRAVSAYRTVEYQRGLYNRYLSSDEQASVDRYSARPGHSEHHTGMALDLFGSQDGLRNFENTPEYPWIRDNGYKYGFIIRYFEDTEHITGYESEPWHIRYVGVDVSTDMKRKNIRSFEEYHAKYLE